MPGPSCELSLDVSLLGGLAELIDVLDLCCQSRLKHR